MRKSILVILTVLVAGMMQFGCGRVGNYLKYDSFMMERATDKLDKRIQHVLEPVEVGSGENKITLYNYKIRICDIDNNQQPTNCKLSTVLENTYMTLTVD